MTFKHLKAQGNESDMANTRVSSYVLPSWERICAVSISCGRQLQQAASVAHREARSEEPKGNEGLQPPPSTAVDATHTHLRHGTSQKPTQGCLQLPSLVTLSAQTLPKRFASYPASHQFHLGLSPRGWGVSDLQSSFLFICPASTASLLTKTESSC